ncbi:metal ABC transporter substrate-binding protein [Methylobacterium brachythecii]|uniref:Metal ABC transporter substrate-binding protein n=1 Tax=Methylobacterium brachythecii TaxID=1176177 RepID=A0A7W6ADF5_9HYPH|nr:metal ABC transporter substrate-binding protein [Methylobacterium brachythecii]MBB3901227.1 zinc/manganese transport system substrate-binding protein [Methylobacterium brachythecii]GLS44589.1 metal ABC transporter substrate-binding protein [Methylobacterium brachythecii]
MTGNRVWGLRRAAAWLLLILAVLSPAAASAEERIKAVATFSILGDLVRQVGGDRVAVTNLVGPDADAHSFSPSPDDARRLAGADIIFVNGLGFEGWMERLIRASGTKAPVIVASSGAKTIAGSRDHADHDHGDVADNHDDPHAWQSVANAKLYVAAIRDGLSRIDAAHAAAYAENARAYTEKLDALEAEIRTTIAEIPEARRRIITTHDSFGYYTQAYGLRFVAPQGLSTDSEAGPRDVARIIRQIRKQKIPAVFLETIADPRLMQQIARESGARVGGRVYSDALSAADGPAPGYLEMMRSNLRAFREALG